ncbi:MAG: potassium channel family protein [Candidatus Micrarchaeota archaeon]
MPSSAFAPTPPKKSLLIPLVLLAAIYVLSIVFFHVSEGWTYLDAAYFTTVTITTVGYGDITPVTEIGKIGAIMLIFSGVSIGLYVISHLGSLRERTIDPHVQRRLDVLRNLTALQTGSVKKEDLKVIKEKLTSKSDKR